MAVSDLSAGGYLNAMQSEKFIRGIIDQPTIIRDCRSVIITGESKKIEKIGFGSRIMRPGEENTALTEEQRAKPSFGKVTLTTKEIIGEIRLSYDTLEANIEQEKLKDTIIQMIQARVALDLEELVMQGDTESDDTYLALMDGFLKQATTNVVDAEADYIQLKWFTDLIKKVPAKYMRDKKAWRMYTSRNLDLAWKEAIAARNTVAGDRFLLQNTNASAMGFEVQEVAMIPEDGTSGDSTDLGQVLLVHPQNMITGFTRKVQIEQDKDITARQHIIVVTLKVDCKYEEELAVGKLKNVDVTIPAEV